MPVFLKWIRHGTEAKTLKELFWYLAEHPPPHQKWQAPIPITPVDDAELPPDDDPLTNTPVPNMFALTIGINEYQNAGVKNLTGAVADADDVDAFLTETLNVPEGNIIKLRDSQATREAIENALLTLAGNWRIKRNDPILIYFAGHGAEARGQLKNTQDADMQMLLPYDFRPYNTGEKRVGQGVLDRKLAHLLQILADSKGDNITVILDCCHSGSGTRQSDPSIGVRGLDLIPFYQVAPDLLEEIGSFRTGEIPKGREKSGLLSHVLLSACKHSQNAKELNGRGVFTQALMSLWREMGVDILTYRDVILHLPDLPLQNPQLEGANQTRILFNSRAPIRRRVHAISCRGPRLFILEAGEAQGVTIEAQFKVFNDMALKNCLGVVEVYKALAFQSELQPIEGQDSFTFDGKAYAVQTRVGRGNDLRLRLPLDQRLFLLYVRFRHEMFKPESDKRRIQLIEEDDETTEVDIAIRIAPNAEGEDVVFFDIMDPTCRKYGLTCMPGTSPVDVVPVHRILRFTADFYWNLNRSSNGSLIVPKIQFSCYKLKEGKDFDETFDTPMEPDIEAGDLNVGGVVTINVDEDANYGYAIKNTSSHPLFVSVFYFDMSDLGITPYYNPPFGKDGNAEPSIQPGGELTLGYGSSGTPYWSYFLRDDQKVDIGYLKLFISTAYVDFSSVEQQTPWTTLDARFNDGGGRPPVRYIWDTLKITIVQKSASRS